MKYLYLFIAAAIIAFTASYSPAQDSDRDRAIKHYTDGNDIEAILALEAIVKQKQYASDAEAINFLGLAYQNALDSKKARKMFEKAVKIDPGKAAYRANLAFTYLLARQLDKSQDLAKKALEIDPANVGAHFVFGTADLWEGKTESALKIADQMLRLDPKSSQGYALKSDALLAVFGKKVAAGSTMKKEIDLLRQSVSVLEEGIRNSETLEARRTLEQKLAGIAAFNAYFSKERTAAPSTPQIPEPGVTPFKILSKPPAAYTESARQSGVQGKIRVAALLGSSGKIEHVLVLSALGYGLDELAYRAAKQIVFQPKMKDGNPVSTVIVLEYNFRIY